MGRQQQVADFAPGESFRQQVAEGEEVPEGLAHLLAFDEQVRPVQPVFHERPSRRLTPRALALRDFILVMREYEVFAAQVQVEARPEQLHAHRAALDVPAGPAFAPRAGPEHLAILRHARLPKREVSDRLLLVFVAAHPLPHAHLIKIQFHQLPIPGAAAAIFLDAEIDRAIRSLVGQAARQELLNERNDLPHVLSRARCLLRQAAVEGLEVVEKGRLELAGELPERRAGLADALDNLVVHVGDIHHLRDGIAFEVQITPHQVAEDERAPIADVREVIDGRAAAVHADRLPGWIQRDELVHRV